MRELALSWLDAIIALRLSKTLQITPNETGRLLIRPRLCCRC